MNRVSIFCLILVCGTVPLWAQSIPLPVNMRWVVEVKPAKEKDEAPQTSDQKVIVKEESISVPGVRQEIRSYRDGSSLTRYVTNRFVLFRDPDTGEVRADTPGETAYGGPIDTKKFWDFAWLDIAQPAGQKTVDGVLCNVFRGPWPPPLGYEEISEGGSPAPIKEGRPTMTAYINAQNRLPVLLETPTETRRYVFSPATSLDIPPEFQEFIKKREAAIKYQQQRFVDPNKLPR